MSGVFGFKDKNEWMSLRYDLTAPLQGMLQKILIIYQNHLKDIK